MNSDLTTYSQRAARIAEILNDVIDLSKYAVNTYASNPQDLEMTNGLKCTWADNETGLPRVAVYIERVDDINDEVRTNRDHVADFPERGESHYDPASASEVATDRPDEYVFLFNYVSDVRSLVGHCRVTVFVLLDLIKHFDNEYADLEPALEIGRTVGCSPYVDDFVPPDFPEKWTRHSWTAFPTPPPGE